MDRHSPGIGTEPRRLARQVLRTAEAAEYVGLSASSLEKMRARGTGPAFIRLGGRAVGYRVDDLERWLDGLRESGDPAPCEG